MNGWISTTSNWLKKQYFNSAHYIDILANQGDKVSEGDIYIFGIKFGKDNRKQAFQLYESVLWFTYRDNINFQGFPDVMSDVGWGCMLRVGQMMLAQVIRIQKGPQFYSEEKYLKEVIKEFIHEDGCFSIQRLVKMGHKYLEKEPGQWYSSYDIAVVLKQALENFDHIHEISKLWIQNLQLILTSSQFSLQDIYNQTKIAQKSNVYMTKPCLLVVVCRLGYYKPEPHMLQKLIQLMKTEKNFVGLLGGRPGKAHYIIGTTEKSFIYLDPHCVKYQMDIESFLCETLFSMSHDKLDSSLGICLYLKNFKQMLMTHQRLRLMKCNDLIYCHQHEKFDCMSLQIEDQQQQIFEVLEPQPQQKDNN